MQIRLRNTSFLLILFLTVLTGRAQVNLVPNPGFELGTCPTYMAQWNDCTGWTNCSGSGTPDYYNTCGTTAPIPYNPVPPNTGMGTCSPHSGNAMMGIVEYDQPFNSYREYVSTKLTCSMLAGYTYTVSFWETASSAPTVKYNSSHIGVYLSATQPVQSGYNCISLTPQFEITSVLTNTTWVQYTFTVTPATTLNYITLGCFRTDAQITTVLQTPTASQPYSNYFFDDIAVLAPPVTPLTSASAAGTAASCFNTSTGSATVTPSIPGTYSYSWSPGNYTTAAVSNMPGGVYMVTVTDAICDNAVATVTISTPPALTSTLSTQTNATCFGSATGAATVAASGGTGALTYSWSPSGGTGPNASGLAAGIYTLAIRDANNCLKNQAVVISQPPAINTSATHSNALCYGDANGSAIVTASGGAGSFSYSWTPGSAASNTIAGIAAGNYSCIVTDANGCAKTQTVSITQPAPLNTGIGASNIACYGNATGSATATANAGTAPYTYSWMPTGNTTFSVSGLAAGNYTCIIKDSHGCAKSETVTLFQPTAITSSVSSVINPSCYGSANGSATVAASGGNGSLSYSWAPVGGTSPVATGLQNGTYTLTMHDANSCVKTQTVSITAPPALLSSALHNNVTCNGAANGTATVTATGGTGAISYSWTPAGITASVATALSPGTYTCLATDANGCTSTQTVSITQPAALSSVASVTNASCYGSANGAAAVTTGGGTGPMSYSWMPVSATSSVATALSPGSYTCSITDANGCAKTQTISIAQPAAISASVNHTDATCFGSANGSATLTAMGGTGALTYSWTPTNNSTAVATGLAAGNYTYTIQDANGCTKSGTTSIGQPAAINAALAASPAASCNSVTPVTVTMGANGGTLPYGYQWSSGQNTPSATVTPTVSSVYSCTLTDAQGCTATRTVAISVGANHAAYTYTLRPCSDSVLFTNTATGSSAYQWIYGDGQTSSLASPSAHLYGSDGTYTVSLIAGAGTACADTTTQVIIIQNIHPAASFQYTYSPCNGAASFTSTAQNASSVSWNLGNGNSSGLPVTSTTYTSGTYTVALAVVSASGCKDTMYQYLNLSIASINADFGYHSGGCGDSTSFTNSSSGATSYHWVFDNGNTSDLASPNGSFSQGVHTVTLTASNGPCSVSIVKSINIQASASIDLSNIPNVFTPNGDGVNDVLDFSPYYKCGSYQFEVFDRWGLSIIKSSQTKNNAWDGRTTSGMAVPDGTYFYILNDQNGNTFRGTVTLFR